MYYNFDSYQYERKNTYEWNRNIKTCKVLADETRVKIVLELLKTDELCACKLLGLVDCQQSTLSHHMKLLVDGGIVRARKDWKWTHYSINKERISEIRNIFKI